MTNRLSILIAMMFIVGCSDKPAVEVEVGTGAADSTEPELQRSISIPKFDSSKREFNLDDGTQCVRATDSGVSCDWKNTNRD